MSQILSFLFLLAVLYPRLSNGQDLYYTVIDKKEGLPSDEVYDLFQDSKGFIWIAHNEGLSRYDGYECKTYSHPQQSSRSGTNIQEDKFGRIWYQNFDGRLYFVQQGLMHTLAQNPPVGYVQFALDSEHLYVYQKKGLDIFDLKTLIYQKTIAFDINNLRYSFFNNGRFYISKKDSLFELDQQLNWKSYPHPVGLDEDLPVIIQASSKSTIVASKFNSSKQCYELTASGYTPKFGLPINNFIQNIACTKDYYWFCTPSGVYPYSHEGLPLNKHQPYFKNKNITSVLQDREGNFWFGTKGVGVLFVTDLNSKMAFDKVSVHKMLRMDSILYIGSMNGELFKANLNDYSIQQIYQDNDRHEIAILDYDSLHQVLLVSSKKFLTISTSGKVQNEWVAAVKAATRINEKYYALAVSGTAGLSLQSNKNEPNEWDAIYNKYEIQNPLVNAQLIKETRGKSLVYNKKTNAIYFACSNGLWKVTPDTIYEITQNDSSLFYQRLCLAGNDIYGFNTNGVLQKIDAQEKIETVALSRRLSRVRKLKQEQHFLFALTDDELLFLNLKQPELGWKKSHLYSSDINDFVLWKDRLILANKEGLLVQQFEQEEARSIAPILHLNGFKINGWTILDNNQLQQLPYNQNNIEIQYSILSFKTQSQFPLYYQINNNDWELAPAETRLLKLAALSSGYYTIKFCLGEPNNQYYPIQIVEFRILVPWWKQWWFFGLCAVFISSLAYAYYRQQTGMLIQQNKLLSEKIELEQNLSNSTLKAIKSQMNPHFFYNALNTIQSFIYSDDKKNASAYLSKFSKLTRMILEMSDKEKIALSEEINALNLYLEIEKARFNDDFEYDIIVDSNIDKELVKIPSMLIQPYVENAIKHGLLHQKENKKLSIHFEFEENFLKVTIHDNGIGRKHSEELKKIKDSKHLSFSSDANATRLAILNRDNNSKTGVKYIDHLNHYNQSLGTTVIIQIPIK